MSTPVRFTRPPSGPRCEQIRAKLEEFAAHRLGPMASGEVQVHLLDCDACSEAFEALLIADPGADAEPVPPPPPVPARTRIDLDFDGILDTPWAWLRSAVEDPALDAEDRTRAAGRRDHILSALRQLVAMPSPSLQHGAVRARGTSSHPPAVAAPPEIVATMRGGGAGPAAVPFEVQAGPMLTIDGRFLLELRTSANTVDGRQVVCVLTLSRGESVSFSGVVTPHGGQPMRTVTIEEQVGGATGASLPAGRVPADRLRLVID